MDLGLAAAARARSGGLSACAAREAPQAIDPQAPARDRIPVYRMMMLRLDEVDGIITVGEFYAMAAGGQIIFT